jgi:hypothetical protein
VECCFVTGFWVDYVYGGSWGALVVGFKWIISLSTLIIIIIIFLLTAIGL